MTLQAQDVREMFKAKLAMNDHLSEETWEALSKTLKINEWVKGKHLCSPGIVAKHIHLILSGTVKVYVDKDGDKVCTNFRFPGQFTAALDSFLTIEPSQYGLEAICPTRTLSIARDDLYRLYKEYPEMNIHGRLVMEQLVLEKRDREKSLLTMSARERYEELMRTQPHYLLHLPQKDVASFLGMAPESLSRLKRQAAR